MGGRPAYQRSYPSFSVGAQHDPYTSLSQLRVMNMHYQKKKKVWKWIFFGSFSLFSTSLICRKRPGTWGFLSAMIMLGCSVKYTVCSCHMEKKQQLYFSLQKSFKLKPLQCVQFNRADETSW